MKAINKTRNTKTFCIDAGHVEDMVAIQKFFTQRKLVSVAYDAISEEYTVRIAGMEIGIQDVRFTLSGLRKITLLELVQVVDFKAVA